MSRRQRRIREKPGFRLNQLPLKQLKNPYQPIEILTQELLEMIHSGSMKILEEVGLEIVNDRARNLMIKHGAEVDAKTGYVKMDRGLVMEKIATIPSEFTLYARNQKFNSVYGGDNINFTLVASAPNCSDLDNGRRTGNFDDYCKFLKLGQTFNVVACYSGYPVEPID